MISASSPGGIGSGAARREPLRIAVVTNVLPHYRAQFYGRLFQRQDVRVWVFCQASIPGMDLALAHERFPDRVTVVPAVGLKGERAAWQRLPWRRLMAAFDVVFVHGNPRIVSSVVLAGLLRARGRPVVLWGQAHTAGAPGFTEGLRLWWWRRFDHLFVYTDGEVDWLRSRGFHRQVVVGMNNGLDQRQIDEVAAGWGGSRLAEWQRQQDLVGRTLVLSCARLVRKNDFGLWVEAMPAVIENRPDLLWCAIGEGPERKALEARARALGVSGHVRWLGGVFAEEELAPWFLSSRLLVHPASIGLTLLHAFGYGLPVITHDDAATQMPEFHAFVSGETGLCYRRGDARSLGDVVCHGLADDSALRRMGEAARRIAREEYNVDIMVDRFVAIAERAGGRG